MKEAGPPDELNRMGNRNPYRATPGFTSRKILSAQAKQDIKIKPSFVPFAWKGFVVVLLGIVVYGVSFLFKSPLPSTGSLLTYAALALIGLGVLDMLIGVVRRNAFTYLITDSDVVVKKQLLRRSVRRIPFSSISDVQVSQSIVGRLARYGDVVPVTKSGYGLVRGTEPGENIVAEMADVPNPDKVADLIMSRLRASKVA
jgi:uncharacterized membrane protein YdbT with pleckstrin-like domain